MSRNRRIAPSELDRRFGEMVKKRLAKEDIGVLAKDSCIAEARLQELAGGAHPTNDEVEVLSSVWLVDQCKLVGLKFAPRTRKGTELALHRLARRLDAWLGREVTPHPTALVPGKRTTLFRDFSILVSPLLLKVSGNTNSTLLG